MNCYKCFVYTCFLLLACFARGTASEAAKYDGPMMEGTKLEIIRSDDGVVTSRMLADRLLQYENGDKVYPAGIYVEFYDTDKRCISATLTASKVYYYAERDIYELKGDVEIKSHEGQKQLNTEELYWNVGDEELYTDKFVRIETEEELLMGQGLSARQDLSQYSVSAPQGFVHVESMEHLSKE